MESLVVFAKNPRVGHVKTRLAASLGDAAAVQLYTAFLLDTIEVCAGWRSEQVAVDPNRRLVLYVSSDIEDPIFADCVSRSGARIAAQPPGDLGVRLETIFDQEFSRGARAVCAIGTDTPTLARHQLDHAYRALQWERVVLGPTTDGGYWLVGAQRPAPDLFGAIPWSTDQVMARTVEKLAAAGIAPQLLPFGYDVDDADDLRTLRWHLQALHAKGCAPAHTWQTMARLGLVETGA